MVMDNRNDQRATIECDLSPKKPKRLASLDIGTVTCRLLVADVFQNDCEELKRCVAITNLGVGVDKTHLLQDEAIERVVQQITQYVSVVNSFKTEEFPEIPIRAVATSAARDAQNSALLVERLKELGVNLSIIEGTREAALSFRGAAQGHEGEHLLVADIGGGSTELVFGIGGQVGFISDGDIMKYIGRSDGSVLDATRMLYRIPDTENFMQRVADLIDLNVMRIATKGAISVPSGSSLDDACRLLAEKRIKKIPVVDAEGCLVGSLSRSDIIRSTMANLASIESLVAADKEEKGERQRT